QRYILGRALYHIAQRRGFRSNRKDQSNDDEKGKVKEAISGLSQKIKDEGCEYLAEYFEKLYKEGKRIRNQYTSRDNHYVEEFHAICRRQELDEDTVNRLEHVLFDQRPLKSQKHTVGHCLFEPAKSRCQASHPDFEEMRMLQTLNQIRMKTPDDDMLRPLWDEEREAIIPLFQRKSKSNFDFEDIAKELAKPYIKRYGKKCYGYYKTDGDKDILFNYPMDMGISGSPFTAGMAAALGPDWKAVIDAQYAKGEGKKLDDKVNDVWHALSFFDNDDKLEVWLETNLGIEADTAKKVAGIKMVSAYASLSHKVIRKILPYMRGGMIYSYAVMPANIDAVLPAYVRDNDDMRKAAVDMAVECLNEYDKKTCECTMYQWLKNFLAEKYHIDHKTLNRLYHPSDLETYPHVRPDEQDRMRLGSPRISSIRNPMAMRSLHRIRHVINALLDKGIIDRGTEVHIELGRELNDANMRAAIRRQNKLNESERAKAKAALKEQGINNASETDIDKYILWDEQHKKCLYTGKQIGFCDIFGPDSKYDIEHTIPRSRGGDSTMENLTLCDSRFNRDVKKTRLPSELANADEVMQRVAFMKEKADDLQKQIRRCRTNASMDKSQKDRIIQKRHSLELQQTYWRNKYRRFEMTEVPEDFSRRQGATAGIVARYARLFLKSLFDDVSIVKGAATADFRKAWKLQSTDEKKSRDNHTHHQVDAVVIACIGRGDYQRLAASYHLNGYADRERPSVPEPWKGFVDDMRRIQAETLISYDFTDNAPKQVRRRIRFTGSHHIKGPKPSHISESDTARLRLHMDTNYGAIEHDGEVKYVVRNSIGSLKQKDIKNIVDSVVRQKVQEAYDAKGDIAFSEPIWMNEAKGIQIKKVRCYAPNVTRPLNIRKHRDISRHEYKRTGHFINDGNYCIAIYEQDLPEGSTAKAKRSFRIVNNLAAASHFKLGNRANRTELYPPVDENGYRLKAVLRQGDSVLLYEKSPEEIYNASAAELCRRLYVVTMIWTDGRVNLRYSQYTRAGKGVAGDYKTGELLRPHIMVSSSKFKALIQNQDFTIDVLGKIKFLKRD
ncbi:MAG TPA: HNH endonuclease domain-containing protein, partial [Muribaculaceae bacterium]|nr:HNH endonuclease domain-containing protein [Muribaculaceae bacterium]